MVGLSFSLLKSHKKSKQVEEPIEMAGFDTVVQVEEPIPLHGKVPRCRHSHVQ